MTESRRQASRSGQNDAVLTLAGPGALNRGGGGAGEAMGSADKMKSHCIRQNYHAPFGLTSGIFRVKI